MLVEGAVWRMEIEEVQCARNQMKIGNQVGPLGLL